VFLSWTWRNAIDTVVDPELFSHFTGLLTGLFGANRQVGFYRFHNEGLYRGEMLTHRVAHNPHIHIAKNFIALIDALLSASPTVPYSKSLMGDEQLTIALPSPGASACESMLAQIKMLVPNFDAGRFRVVLINPNASEMLPQRRWMPERFAELIRRILAANDDVLIMITGAPSERAEIEKLASQCTRCVVPECRGISHADPTFREALWDRYFTAAPRLRTSSELRYSDRRLRSKSSPGVTTSTRRR
jgi:ADP-heptose:LPS heptosyltransferase